MKKVRILVIDDDEVACEFLQEALLRAGYEVDAFTSAREALDGDLARYDILLSDIRMPDIDGLQFLKAVHQKWPQLPVILMTAFGSLETTMEALRLGVPTAGYDHGGVGEILRAIYPAGLLPMERIDEACQRIVQLVQQPSPVPAGDFFPLRSMLSQTLDLYEQLARTPRRQGGQ